MMYLAQLNKSPTLFRAQVEATVSTRVILLKVLITILLTKCYVDQFLSFQNQWSRGVLLNRCSSKFHKIHIKTLVPEFLCSPDCLTAMSPASLLIKKRFWNRCFSVNFVNFLRTSFFTEHAGGCFCHLLQQHQQCSYSIGTHYTVYLRSVPAT